MAWLREKPRCEIKWANSMKIITMETLKRHKSALGRTKFWSDYQKIRAIYQDPIWCGVVYGRTLWIKLRSGWCHQRYDLMSANGGINSCWKNTGKGVGGRQNKQWRINVIGVESQCWRHWKSGPESQSGKLLIFCCISLKIEERSKTGWRTIWRRWCNFWKKAEIA